MSDFPAAALNFPCPVPVMGNKNPELPFPNGGAIVVLDDDPTANSAERGEGFDFSGEVGYPCFYANVWFRSNNCVQTKDHGWGK